MIENKDELFTDENMVTVNTNDQIIGVNGAMYKACDDEIQYEFSQKMIESSYQACKDSLKIMQEIYEGLSDLRQ